ncbi:hypothetical protein [Alkalispirochaeta americana]|uniref:hypothetical protein n=1 Tax=Alkalispirochaeta americana TaxID=159291 RepID=UPI000970C1B2|nr:hypothetical protein [Alkalispirochaeta americana]
MPGLLIFIGVGIIFMTVLKKSSRKSRDGGEIPQERTPQGKNPQEKASPGEDLPGNDQSGKDDYRCSER